MVNQILEHSILLLLSLVCLVYFRSNF